MKTKDVTQLAREKKVAALASVGLVDPKHPDSIFFRAEGKIAKTRGYCQLEVHPVFLNFATDGPHTPVFAVDVRCNFLNADQVAALRCFLAREILTQPKH